MDSSEGMDYESPNSPRRSGKDGGAAQTQKFRLLEQKSWRFTYEALTHVHSLRLFLFNSVIPVPWKCMSLTASLASESPVSSSPVLLCQWVSGDGEAHKLFVPVLVCLIDYSVPFAAFGRSDHIEIKLTLLSSGGSFVGDLSLLGLTYRGEPVDSDGGEVGVSAFSLNSDTDLLASKQGVTFYCRSCSVELINQPISCFRALASTEWRELADHWFGMCCCRDGVQTKSLIARFDELMTPTTGVCLVGSTICIVHRDDFVRKMVDDNQHISMDDEAQCTSGTENEDEIRTGDRLDAGMTRREDFRNLPFGTDTQLCGHDSRPSNGSAMTTNGHSHNALEESATCCSSSAASHGNVRCNIDELPGYVATATNGFSHDAVEEPVEPHSCCSGSSASHGNGGPDKLPDHAVKAKTLANGFMSSVPSSKSTAFNCYNCANLIGVVPGGTEEGLQLFKCRISSDLSTGGPSDIFRFHTLERVFSNELFSNAEEDSSYRYILRDLNSRSPLLQLVIINQDSWNCSGLCAEEQRLVSELERSGSIVGEEVSMATGQEDDASCTLSSQNSGLMTSSRNQKLSPVFLEPVMKVLFCDTSSFSSEELREVESWGQKNQSDDVYMLDTEVKALARSLQANRKLFPESSAAFQQFQFSFLAR